jgi:hypothetical protein
MRTNGFGYVIERERQWYGPEVTHELVSLRDVSFDGLLEPIGEYVFESRDDAISAIEVEEREETRGYGAYMCSHNESGSPQYRVLSVRHPRAMRLLREKALRQ